MTDAKSGKKRLLIDTDPGVDDSMAILFAFASPEVEIEGLSTVFGNVGVDQTTKNALRLVELAGHPEVPVARGADKPSTSSCAEAPTAAVRAAKWVRPVAAV